MNDDYLWDKTGEPDPQVKKLEEILGTLRYQPKPLELPKDLPQPRKRNYFPWLAIAASLLLAILAGAFWLSTRTRNEAPPREARVSGAFSDRRKEVINSRAKDSGAKTGSSQRRDCGSQIAPPVCNASSFKTRA